jgi:hypothetical protein
MEFVIFNENHRLKGYGRIFDIKGWWVSQIPLIASENIRF